MAMYIEMVCMYSALFFVDPDDLAFAKLVGSAAGAVTGQRSILNNIGTENCG